MNEDRNQDRVTKQQARQKHPDEWQQDLNPDHLTGQNIGRVSDVRTEAGMTAFHLRKRGRELRGIDDEELKQVPLVPDGTHLQQGATDVDLNQPTPQEFTARADMRADPAIPMCPRIGCRTKSGTD